VSLVAFVSIIFVGLKEAFLKRILMALVDFNSGSLIGGGFIHLLPEAVEITDQGVIYYAIAGIILFLVTEKFLYWSHCHEETCKIHVFVYLNLIENGINNFVDGMIIATSFMPSYDLGLATTLAVIFY
jgi:zinc and cadmium transporter